MCEHKLFAIVSVTVGLCQRKDARANAPYGHAMSYLLNTLWFIYYNHACHGVLLYLTCQDINICLVQIL